MPSECLEDHAYAIPADSRRGCAVCGRGSGAATHNNPNRRMSADPSGSPYAAAIEAQRQTLADWRKGRLTLTELHDRFRDHVSALAAAGAQ